MQAVLDTLPTQLAVVGASGTTVVTNVGWRATRHVELSYGEGPVAEVLRALVAVPSEQATVEVEEETAEGSRWYEVRIAPLGELGSLIAIDDRTKHKLRERAAQRVKRELSFRRRDLSEIAAASRALKTPLRGISNLADWALEDVAPLDVPDVRRHLTLLVERVRRMDAMLDALLRFAKLDEEDEVLSEVDTGVLVSAIAQRVERPASTVIEIVTPLPVLTTSRAHLRQIFTELIENAIAHHHEDAGRIEIGVRDAGELWEFRIVDDGPGLEARAQERIFHLFQTGRRADDNDRVGVGLALVKRIIEDRGGDVWVESKPNEGSTFFFTWPKKH